MLWVADPFAFIIEYLYSDEIIGNRTIPVLHSFTLHIAEWK